MEFIDFNHIPSGGIPDFEPDLIIAASGYESRSLVIPQILSNKGQRKVALAFTERKNHLHRPQNDHYYRENQYEIIYFTGYGEPDFDAIFSAHKQAQLNVLIDISIMTRKWYYAFLKYLHTSNRFNQMQIRVAYCPAFYSEPVPLRRKISLRNLENENRVKRSYPPGRKTALILGMGIEEGLGQRIFKKINPDRMILVYADPAVQKEYVENIFITNHTIINRIPIRDMIEYPVLNASKIYKRLIDIVLPLREDHHVIIVPQGPKIFSFIAMLLQFSYPDVELICPGYHLKNATDRKPYPEITGFDMLFGSE